MVQRIGDLDASFETLEPLFRLAALESGYDYPLLYPGVDSGSNSAI